jgi:hypothetical protein
MTSRAWAATRVGEIPACHLNFVLPGGASGNNQRCLELRVQGPNIPECNPENKTTQALSSAVAK